MNLLALTGDMPRMTTYRTPAGGTGVAVAGPTGNYLITQASSHGRYDLWRSDSLKSLRTSRDQAALIDHALTIAVTGRREVVIHQRAILNAWTRTVVPGTTVFVTDEQAHAHAAAQGWKVLPYWAPTVAGNVS